jgi:hypothetical protein
MEHLRIVNVRSGSELQSGAEERIIAQNHKSKGGKHLGAVAKPEIRPPTVGRVRGGRRRGGTYRQHPFLAQQWRVEAQMVPGHCSASAK